MATAGDYLVVRAPENLHAATRPLITFLFVVTIIVCVFGYHPARTPIELDNQTFFYIAERAASGVPPHVSVVNHKHALTHLLSGAAIAAGREAGIDDVYAARALSIAVCGATVALVALLTLRLTQDVATAFFSGLAMLTFSGFLRQAAMGFRPQLFATLFVVWALVAFCDRKHVRAGAYAACAFLCWQPAGVVIAAVTASAALERGARAHALRVLAGSAAVLAGYELYFVKYGAVGEQLFQTWVMASYGAFGRSPGALDTVQFLLSPDAGRCLAAAVIPASFAGLSLWLGVTCVRRRAASLRFWQARADVRAAVLTVLGSLAFTFVDHQAYPDKFFLLPFMAISAAIFFRELVRVFGTGKTSGYGANDESPPAAAHLTWRSAFVLASCVLFLSVLIVRGCNDYRVFGDELGQQRLLAATVRAAGDGKPSIWFVGCLHLLALNRQPNYTSFGVFLDERVRRYAGPGYRPLVDGRMPRIILWSRAGKFRFPWLEKEYEERRLPDLYRASVRLWIRKRHLTAETDTGASTPG